MKPQHQHHSVLAIKYFQIARTIGRKIKESKKADPELEKAHQEFEDMANHHSRIAFLFPECNEFAPVR